MHLEKQDNSEAEKQATLDHAVPGKYSSFL